MQIRCPSCHAPFDTAAQAGSTEIVCPTCGSSFNLIGGDATATHRPSDAADVRAGVANAPDGSAFGHFELLEEVGVGGFGSVWRARDTKLERQVAIKIPHRQRLDPRQAELFLRDARAAAQLRHPNIVGVHEIGVTDRTLYIVSDFVEGTNLREWLVAQRLTAREAVLLVAKIARAVHHAHEAGVVHRDLKPGNVMIDRDGQPHVIDFGLARRAADDVTLTVAGQVLGTPAYMSPEQARGEGHVADRRADIYSLGVMLFELLTGELPFRGDTRMLVVQIVNDEPPSPRKFNARISRDLETVVLRCLQKDPSRRYQRASELADDLERYLAGKPIAARPIGRVERSWRWCRRNRAVASLGAAALVILAAGTGVSTYYALEADKRAREADAERQRAQESLAEATRQRERAEVGFSKARRAVDDSFTAISQNQLINAPGLQPLRKTLLQKALEYYEGFARDMADDPGVRSELATTHYRVGRMRYELGEKAQSEASYRQAIAIREALLRDDPTAADHRHALSDLYHELGILQSRQGQTSEAAASYGTAIELSEALARENPDDGTYQNAVALLLVNLAATQKASGRTADAEKSFRRALEIDERLAVSEPTNVEFHRDRARCYEVFAELLADMGRTTEALPAYRKSVDIYEQIVRAFPEDLEFRNELALGYYKLGGLQHRVRSLAASEATYRKVVDIAETLRRENPAVLDYQQLLAAGNHALSNVLRDTKRLAEAEGQIRQAVELNEELVAKGRGDKGTAENLRITYRDLVSLLFKMGRPADARDTIRSAIERWEAKPPAAIDAPARDHTLAFLYASQAVQLASTQGDWEPVAESLSKATSLAPRDAAVQMACGDAAAAAQHWSEAAAAYTRADLASGHHWETQYIAAMLQLAAGNDDEYRRGCRELLARHGDDDKLFVKLAIVLTCVVGENAVDDWPRIVEIARKLVALEPINPAFQTGLGAVLVHAGRADEAIAVLGAAIPMHTMAGMVAPQLRDQIELSRLVGELHLAIAYRALDKTEQALSAHERTRRLIEQMEKSPPQFDAGLALWAVKYAGHIGRRKLALHFDGFAGPETAAAARD